MCVQRVRGTASAPLRSSFLLGEHDTQQAALLTYATTTPAGASEVPGRNVGENEHGSSAIREAQAWRRRGKLWVWARKQNTASSVLVSSLLIFNICLGMPWTECLA